MTTYTTLSDADLSVDKPITQGKMRALRDNPTAITEGVSNAPKIQTAALDTDAVTSAKILNGSIITDKIFNGAVTSDKIEDNAVNGDKIESPEFGSSYNVFQWVGDSPITTNTGGSFSDDEFQSYAINSNKSLSCSVLVAGVIKVSFQHRSNSGTTYARIAKNGVELAGWNTTSQTFVARSLSVTVSVGDRIQVQHLVSSGAISYLNLAVIQSANNTFCVA